MNPRAEIFSPNFRESISLGKLATVFQTEALAFTASAYNLRSRDNAVGTIKVLSDNQAVIKAVKATSKIVADCKKVLNRIAIIVSK